MSPSAHAAALELLADVMSAPCVPARKQAGWKRDQHLRRTRPIAVKFLGEITELRSAEDAQVSARPNQYLR